MPWGQEDNQAKQAREAATALFKLVGAIEKDLARLQEQQRSDEGRYKELRRDVAELRSKLQELELRYKDFDELLGRIQHLETMLSTFGADFGRAYVTRSDFEEYRLELQKRADNLRVEMAIAEAKRKEKIWRLAGGLLASFLLGLSTALPKIYEWAVALIERLIG